MRARLERRAAAEPPAVARLRREVVIYAQQLGATPAAGIAIAHAVTEALNNVVIHAYADATPGDVTVEAWADDHRHLLVRVSDGGHGMVPRPDRRGLGIGLNLMAALADDVRLRDEPHRAGTTVSMSFALDLSVTRLGTTDVGPPVPTPFAVHEATGDGGRLIAPRGDLDIVGAPVLEERLREIGQSGEPATLDLAGLSFIDASGLTTLIRAKQWAADRGWPLTIANPARQALHVMELTGVLHLLGVPPEADVEPGR